MRLNEIDLIGKKSPTASAVMQKHKISSDQLSSQLEKGIRVEKEHVNSEAEAREIALDHLWEFPDYYDRLEKVEKKPL